MKGTLVILSGPSGVGKDTVLDLWQERNPRIVRVVATTTRAPRPGERDTIDYTFVAPEEFHALASQGEFLEHKEVHGNFYATPASQVVALEEAGKVAVLKIDTEGALEVMAKRPDALTIMLLPPSFEELERRIRTRGSDSPEQIERRLHNARQEMDAAPHYKIQIINHDVEAVLAELERLVAAF